MAKKINTYKSLNSKANAVSEPAVAYLTVKPNLLTKEFTYNKFLRIANKIPFTQKDWASILHLSERTLQRYAKENTAFEGIYVDRILQIEHLINVGLQVFNSSDDLYEWLKKEKNVLGTIFTFQALSTTHGIQHLIAELNRILYGIYI